MYSSEEKTLLGLSILITRPFAASLKLAFRVGQKGGTSLIAPLLRIKENPISPARWQDVQKADLLLFVSVNAVNALFSLWQQQKELQATFDLRKKMVLGMGEATTSALHAKGALPMDPGRSILTTETVLQHPCIKDANKGKIAIIKGLKGRAVLAQELQRLSWQVKEVRCYESKKVTTLPFFLVQKLEKDAVDVILATSVQSMIALFNNSSSKVRAKLEQIPYIALSKRIADFLQEEKKVRSTILLVDPLRPDALMRMLDVFAKRG